MVSTLRLDSFFSLVEVDCFGWAGSADDFEVEGVVVLEEEGIGWSLANPK